MHAPRSDATGPLAEALARLSRSPKSIPATYLWDERGSELFDRICATRDYYLTRRETALLERAAPAIADAVGPGCTLVEYGSGASRKARLLLDAFERPRGYVAIDISAAYLEAAAARVAADYPSLAVIPVAADYTRPITLPPGALARPSLGFFPGSTVGNFAPDAVVAFLERARATLAGGWFLVGQDPNRDPALLRRAYGEADGLMAALHLNALVHLNRTVGADFDPDGFAHEIRLLDDPPRVEAYLRATRAATYRVGGRPVRVEAGELVRTDASHKYDPDAFRALAARAGWETARSWIDEDGLFALHLMTTPS